MGVVSTYALVVDDLDDGGQAAGEGAVALEEDNTANLDEAPVGCDNGGVTHFCGVLGGCRLVGRGERGKKPGETTASSAGVAK